MQIWRPQLLTHTLIDIPVQPILGNSLETFYKWSICLRLDSYLPDGLTGVSSVTVYMHLWVVTSMSVYDVVHCIWCPLSMRYSSKFHATKFPNCTYDLHINTWIKCTSDVGYFMQLKQALFTDCWAGVTKGSKPLKSPVLTIFLSVGANVFQHIKWPYQLPRTTLMTTRSCHR